MSAPVPTVQRPPRVPLENELAATWALFGFALLFYGLRIGVRLWNWRRLYWDDAWGTLAILLLLAMSIVLTVAATPMYNVLLVGSGLKTPGPNFMEDSSVYLKLQFAHTVLFWTTLWAVKGCFLAFFFRLTTNLRYPRLAWWATVVICPIAYIGCVITYPLTCSSFVLGECEKPLNIERSWISVRYSTAVDVITDAMIIALPLFLAIRVRLPLAQKFALAAVFGVGATIMVFAAIRIMITHVEGKHVEASWLNLWSQIEASVAVIISSVPSFKVLFTKPAIPKSSYEERKRAGAYSGRLRTKGGTMGKSAPPSSIQLSERGKHFTVDEHGTIGMSAGSKESSEVRLV